ncbi:hypothetical protein Vi05172_g2948 [Venturia inaequalis]|uniref:PLL-like beta propeller domain-containing protein n=2 Tax=Venturia inaequalis TaxID=5025 RepID=A0A8H3VII5_VENIN|nr:hypothetical protein EG327_002657 [Venturia inaequalis]RDI87047.1 hypothetical protein Vi05172_g2948 [Venturia inaequalis]
MAPFVGQLLHTAVAVVSWTKGRLDVFAIGDNHGMWHKTQSMGAWWPSNSQWEDIGAPLANFSSAPAAVSHTVGTYDVFAVGSDGQAYHKWFNKKLGPSTLEWEAQGGKFAGDLAVTSRAPGKFDIVGRGQDRVVYHKEWTGKGYVPGTTTWTPIGGVFKTDPTVTSRTKNYLDIFTVGENGEAYYKAQENGVWLPSQKNWSSMGGNFISKLTAVSSCSTCLEVFGVGPDGAAYHKWWNGKVWSPSISGNDWAPLGGNFATDLVAVSKAPGKVDVFGVGVDKHAYVKTFNGTVWSADWQLLAGNFNSAVDAVSSADNRVEVFGVGEKKAMLHRYTDAPGKWTPSSGEWASIGGSHIYP